MNLSGDVLQTDHASIKSRMLKRIMELWGIPSLDTVDPVIKLIVDVLAYELAGVGHAMEHSDALLMEKLAEILLPGSWLVPRPFHALVRSEPLDSQVTLSPDNLFFIPSRQFDHSGAEEIFDVFFSPLGSTQLIKGNLAFLATRRHLHRLEAGGKKSPIASGRSKGGISDRTLWLGLTLDSRIESLEQLNLNVDLGPNAFQLSSLLGQTRWFTEAGLPLKVEYTRFLEEGEGNTRFNGKQWEIRQPVQSILTDIADHYHGQFLTLRADSSGNRIPAKKKIFPEVFLQEFGEGITEELIDPVSWFRVEFPAAFLPEVVESLRIQLNVFPMVCRKAYYGQAIVKNLTKIIPLPVGERFTFFAMDRIYDSNGTYFRPRSLRDIEAKKGSFYLHKGVLERFDQRNAGAQIAKLLRVVREEGAVMAAFGQDLTLTNLNNLKREIDAFQKRLDRTKSIEKAENNFMVLEPYPDSGTVEFEYWGIMGQEAATVSPGATLQQYKDLSVAPGTTKLLTRPSGGAIKEVDEQKVRALRYGLLTRDRMVSREDIRQFLFFSLGEFLEKIEIKEGVSISNHPKKGLVRTIEIELTPSPQARAFPEVLASRLPGLQQQLNRRSIHSAKYNLRIKNQLEVTNQRDS